MRLEISETSFSTPDSVTLRFNKSTAIEIYKPGQHGQFVFDLDGEKVTRTYSFHTVADIDADVAITIRAVENGRLSNFVINNKIGSVELTNISGSFFVDPSPDIKRHLVMFAGGSGITPIMAMIKATLHQEPQSSITLIYSNRTYERIIFRDELNRLENKFPSRLRILHVITRDENIPSDFLPFYKGTLSRLIIRKMVKVIQSEINHSTEFFLCGPFQFMELIEDSLASLNIARINIHKEHFFIPETKDSNLDFSNLPSREVIIQLPDKENFLVVYGGKSILQAALQNNIKLTHSCTEGQCGMCRAYLLSGEVKLRKNHILTPEELSAGQILLCQGFPISDNVLVKPIH